MSLPIVKTTTSLAAAILGSQMNTGNQAGGVTGYLKFDFQSGRFSFGREAEDVTGDTLLVNVRTIAHGWVLWAGDKVQKVYAPFNEPLPMPMAPVNGKEPSEARAFQGNFWDDGKPGPSVTFEINSHGGRQAINALVTQVFQRAASEPEFLFPLVALESESYANKTYGRTIYNPVLRVVDWANEAGELRGATPAALAAPAEPPRRRRVV